MSDIDTLNCMKTVPSNVDTRLKYGSCEANLYGQWIYDPVTGSMCNPPILTTTPNCLKISGLAIDGADIISVPYDGTSSMQWDIIQAV